jgi:hypothetical protein
VAEASDVDKVAVELEPLLVLVGEEAVLVDFDDVVVPPIGPPVLLLFAVVVEPEESGRDVVLAD